MLAIRFQRTGRKNDASFRIVVSEKTKHPLAGNPLATVGSYNPKTKHTVIDAEAVKHWLSKGAQASGTVNNLLVSKGVIDGKKVNVRITKVAPKKEESAQGSVPSAQSEAAQTPAAEAAEEETKTEEAAPEAPAEEKAAE